MVIEVGKFYKNKQGNKAKVITYSPGAGQDYRVLHGDDGPMIWHCKDGEAICFREQFDLVEEWKYPEEMATNQTKEYKTWGEMTPEEKGALLLAHHEGETIEYTDTGITWWKTCDPTFFSDLSYRVQPKEPKVEEKVFDGVYLEDSFLFTYSMDWGDNTKGTATVTYTDGKPTKMVWESTEA